MGSVLASIRTVFVPVRREGWPFILAAVAAALILGFLWQPLLWIGLIVAAWCAYFFRDPTRVTPLDPAIAVSPADGRVSFIGTVDGPHELALAGRKWTRVSVFMNVFDCHVNRAPVPGRVENIVYTPGKFFNAELDKASEHNERNGIVIASPHGPVAVVQIAGLVARRIVCDTTIGASLAAGERIGMIRFGSRLDVYLPPEAIVLVAIGQTAIAGETVIARFGQAAAAVAAVRID